MGILELGSAGSAQSVLGNERIELETVIRMNPAKGVKLKPDEHHVVETMFGMFLRQRLNNPMIFTYRHKLENSWMVAQWLNPEKTVFTEIWGVEDSGNAPLDAVVGPEALDIIKQSMVNRGQMNKMVRKSMDEKQHRREQFSTASLEARVKRVKHWRKKLERQGRIKCSTAQYLERIQDGTIPWQPDSSQL